MSLVQALFINLGSIIVPGVLLYGLLVHLGRLRNKTFGAALFSVFILTLVLLCFLQILALDVLPPLPHIVDAALKFSAYLGLAFVLLRAMDLIVIEGILIDGKGLYLPRILRWVITVIGLAITALILMRTVLGINVVALVAVPTVLTAVLGFALKDTLERVVSGIILGRLIREGDWVTLQGSEGKVANINLGFVTLIRREGDAVIIPNNIVAHNQIENHTRPFERFASHVEVDAHYRYPPLEIHRILLDSAKAAYGVLADPAPIVYTQEFRDSGIQYKLKFWIRDLDKRPTIESEVRSYVWYAFQRHGIEIPFPQRVIQTLPQTDNAALEAQRILAIRDQLQKIDFLKALASAELETLARSVETRVYLPHENIVRQGEAGDEFFILTSGEAEVLVDSNGKRMQVATLKEGQFFGEMALLTGEPRAATVCALSQLSVLVVSKSAMARAFGADPSLIDHISAILAERQSHLTSKKEAAGQSAIEEETKKKSRTLGTRIRKFFGL